MGESSYRASGDLLGKSGRCKRCGQSFLFQVAVDILDSTRSDTNTGGKERQVALKVPHPHLLRKAKDRQHYFREAKTAARLRHAPIVPLFEATINGDDLYFASAFIEGKPLDAVLRERRPGMVEAVGWVIHLARALDYAHGQGVI